MKVRKYLSKTAQKNLKRSVFENNLYSRILIWSSNFSKLDLLNQIGFIETCNMITIKTIHKRIRNLCYIVQNIFHNDCGL